MDDMQSRWVACEMEAINSTAQGSTIVSRSEDSIRVLEAGAEGGRRGTDRILICFHQRRYQRRPWRPPIADEPRGTSAAASATERSGSPSAARSSGRPLRAFDPGRFQCSQPGENRRRQQDQQTLQIVARRAVSALMPESDCQLIAGKLSDCTF